MIFLGLSDAEIRWSYRMTVPGTLFGQSRILFIRWPPWTWRWKHGIAMQHGTRIWRKRIWKPSTLLRVVLMFKTKLNVWYVCFSCYSIKWMWFKFDYPKKKMRNLYPILFPFEPLRIARHPILWLVITNDLTVNQDTSSSEISSSHPFSIGIFMK